MVSRDFAKAQILRLAGLKFYPAIDEAVKEMVDVAEKSGTEASLIQALSDLITEVDECPKPADIHRAIAAEDNRGNSWQPPPLTGKQIVVCQRCAGFLNVLNPESAKYESCTCETAMRPSPDGKSTVGRELAESMNRNMAPPVVSEKTGQHFGGEDFDATVRRAIVARIGTDDPRSGNGSRADDASSASEGERGKTSADERQPRRALTTKE